MEQNLCEKGRRDIQIQTHSKVGRTVDVVVSSEVATMIRFGSRGSLYCAEPTCHVCESKFRGAMTTTVRKLVAPLRVGEISMRYSRIQARDRICIIASSRRGLTAFSDYHGQGQTLLTTQWTVYRVSKKN